MKKKIAILTQPLGVNYGGILQNYALQTVLKKMGHHPITINRWENNPTSWFNKQFYYFKLENIFYKNNFNFLRNNVNLTRRLDADKKFYNHFKKNIYDAFVVGSDQTWRPKFSPNIDNYFLDFLTNKKINSIRTLAYASSFGTAEWEFTDIQTHNAKVLVKQFDAVSVREDSGVDLCKNYLGIEAELVLDPTMLVDIDDYRKLYANKNFGKRAGIFVYVLDTKDENDQIINHIAHQLNLKIFRNQPQSAVNSNEKTVKGRKYPPLESWIKAFDDAKFIVTDSFHGTVFSILYNKPFIAIVNKKRGASRFTSLLQKLGLENRLIEDITGVNEKLLSEKIDYFTVNKKLEVLKKQSLEFLNINIS